MGAVGGRLRELLGGTRMGMTNYVAIARGVAVCVRGLRFDTLSFWERTRSRENFGRLS